MTNILQNQPTKYGIALHTSTPELGLAISNFVDTSQFQIYNLGRDLSSHIHHYLIELIKPHTWSDLAFIAVAKGPGGFTGSRIGIAIARTLAQQLEIPVFPISTLAAIAWQSYRFSYHNLNSSSQSSIIAVEMPAQQGKIFGAIYQITYSDIIPLLADTVFTSVEWHKTLEQSHPTQKILATTEIAKSIISILELAHLEWQQGKQSHWSQALPYYGQHPIDI